VVRDLEGLLKPNGRYLCGAQGKTAGLRCARKCDSTVRARRLRDVHSAPQRTEGALMERPGLLAVITGEYDPAAHDWKGRPTSRDPRPRFPCFLIPAFGSRTVLLEYRCCLLRTITAMKRPDRRTHCRENGDWHGTPILPSLSPPLIPLASYQMRQLAVHHGRRASTMVCREKDWRIWVFLAGLRHCRVLPASR
jgi:hypothetical protein